MQNKFDSIVRLICGSEFDDTIEIDQILKNISISIRRICIEIEKLINSDPHQMSLFGPYLGRALLEAGTTALVARIDPFRVLITKKRQEQGTYKLGERDLSGFSWKDDVMPEIIRTPWSDSSVKNANTSRGLLGTYQAEFALLKAADKIFDNAEEDTVGNWYPKLVRSDANGLIASLRQSIAQQYSSHSKGVHHELLINPEIIMDNDTIKSSINDTLYSISTLALLVSQVPYAYKNQNLENSLADYKCLQSLELI